MPRSKLLMVMIGFPIVATMISLLLVNRGLIARFGLDFSTTFRVIVICWYVAQIFWISKLLGRIDWSWSRIGFGLSKVRTVYFCLGYLLFALGLMAFVEYALANGAVDSEKLQAVVGLSPRTTVGRLTFIILGLVAGLAEEMVYRGYVISGLISRGFKKWQAVLLAALPFFFQHGIKAYQLNWGAWYIAWGVAFGCMFLWRKNLYLNIVIHWLVILSAMAAVLQAVK
ncbi:hypothetical protein XB05_19425 [Xanthomonas arboricola]|nr:hypothetical protein XB05_19425 [Xanthomonas arboricola]